LARRGLAHLADRHRGMAAAGQFSPGRPGGPLNDILAGLINFGAWHGQTPGGI
jgi:hypothetical protein